MTTFSAEAQFNARGRSRPTRPETKSSAPSQPSVQRPQQSSTQAESPDARRQVLIERYRGLIVSSPGEDVPLKRLAQLLRERDGNLNAFLAEFGQKLESAPDRYAHLVAWAGLLEENSESEKAAAKLKEATSLAPNRTEAWLLLSRIQGKRGDQGAARTSLERALPGLRGPSRTMALRNLRDLCLDQEDYDGARKYHQLLTREASGNIFLQGELGRQLLARGHADLAIEELSRVTQSARGDARAMAPAFRDLGMAQLEGDQLDEAVASLSKASRLAVSQPGLRTEIDELLARAHRKRGTLPEFLKNLEDSAHTADRLELLGRLYEEEGRTEDAAKTYTRALAKAPQNLDIRLRLVRLLELSGDLPGATRELEQLLRRSPQDITLALRLMELLLAQGRREEALTQWDRVERLSARDPEASLLLVDFAERLGEPERQKRLLERLLRSGHRDSRYLVELGSRFYREGQEKKARKVWDRIVEGRPRDAFSHVTLGEVLIDHEALADGVEALEKAVEIDPRNPRSRRALALGLERAATQAQNANQRQYEQQALVQWHALLELDSSSTNDVTLARRRIIRLEKRRKRLPQFLASLEHRLKKNPKDLNSAHLLAEGYLANSSYQRAIETLKHILEQQKGDRQALLQLETAYLAAGEYDQVIATLEQLIAADPARARQYYDRMAVAATKKRDFQGALRYAELSVERNPTDPEAMAQLGELYLSQGKLERAEGAFRRALELDDRQHRVTLALSELLAQTKRSDEALPLLFRVIRQASDPDLVARASRRALSMSVPTDQTQRLEEVLRPLAMARSDQPLYRTLLLETLSAQFYPLYQKARFGTDESRREALYKLGDLADRSMQPLLSALASTDPRAAQEAIRILSFGDSPSASRALITFAAGSEVAPLRLQALLAAGRTPRRGLAPELRPFIFEEETVGHGQLATAATWALAHQADPGSIDDLLLVLEFGSPDMRAYAAWGLSMLQALAPSAQERVLSGLLQVLETPSAGSRAQAAAALSLGHLLHTSRTEKPLLERVLLSLRAGCALPSKVVSQASLRALALIDDGEATKRLVARALLSPSVEHRRAASLAAVHLVSAPTPLPSLLPESLTATELSSLGHLEAHLSRPDPSQIDRGVRVSALLGLGSTLGEQTILALRSSPDSATAALGQIQVTPSELRFGELLQYDDRGEGNPDSARGVRAGDTENARSFLEELRQTLTADLVRLTETAPSDLGTRALSLLRFEDGPAAKKVIDDALTSSDERTFQTALEALAASGSERALKRMAEAEPGESWGRRRRRVLALERLAPKSDQDAKIRALLEKYKTDPSPLVRIAAEEALK